MLYKPGARPYQVQALGASSCEWAAASRSSPRSCFVLTSPRERPAVAPTGPPGFTCGPLRVAIDSLKVNHAGVSSRTARDLWSARQILHSLGPWLRAMTFCSAYSACPPTTWARAKGWAEVTGQACLQGSASPPRSASQEEEAGWAAWERSGHGRDRKDAYNTAGHPSAASRCSTCSCPRPTRLTATTSSTYTIT